MHERAGDLIPELQGWNHGKGISLPDFIGCVGRYDHAIGYATLFWPDFSAYDDCVFRRPPDQQNYDDWMGSLKGDRSHVESMLNHLHILDIFSADSFEPGQELVLHLARVLEDIWSCKLRRDFPERRFVVSVQEGTPEYLLQYEITFFQER